MSNTASFSPKPKLITGEGLWVSLMQDNKWFLSLQGMTTETFQKLNRAYSVYGTINVDLLSNWCNFLWKVQLVSSLCQTIPREIRKNLFQRASEWFVSTVNHHGRRICYTLSYCLEVTPYLLSRLHFCPDGSTLKKKKKKKNPTSCILSVRVFTFLLVIWTECILCQRQGPVVSDLASLCFILQVSFIAATPTFQSANNKVFPPTCMHTGTLFRLIKAVWVLKGSTPPKYVSAH